VLDFAAVHHDCGGCGACANICPDGAIKMTADERTGFLYPRADASLCTGCSACHRACPAAEPTPKHAIPEVYAAWAKDSGLRFASSSGGLFTLMAEEIIRRGGAVYGAVLDHDLIVRHKATTSVAGLAAMRGSKYVQSDSGHTFREARDWLDAGKPLLYSGTPCQIAGLRAYLGQEYENLYLIDLICFGVPSPLAFSRHIKHLEQKRGSTITAVNFRDKRKYGWRFAVSYRYADGYESKPVDTSLDAFMYGLFNNRYTRDCCASCPYTTLERVSDITLGDFWGIMEWRRDIQGKTGVSMALISTDKGRELFDSAADKAVILEETAEHALRSAPRLAGIRHTDGKGYNSGYYDAVSRLPYEEVERLYLRPKHFWLRRLLPAKLISLMIDLKKRRG